TVEQSQSGRPPEAQIVFPEFTSLLGNLTLPVWDFRVFQNFSLPYGMSKAEGCNTLAEHSASVLITLY
ncbi:MAG: hypothetical protein ACRC4N_01340, partial [Gammaproteobacteria bacterium]